METSQEAYEQARWDADRAGQRVAAHRAAFNTVEGTWQPQEDDGAAVTAVLAFHQDAIEHASRDWEAAVAELRRHELIPGVPLWRFAHPGVAVAAVQALLDVDPSAVAEAAVANLEERWPTWREDAHPESRWPAGSGGPPPDPSTASRASAPGLYPDGLPRSPQPPEAPSAATGLAAGWPHRDSNGAVSYASPVPGWPHRLSGNGGPLTPGTGRFAVDGEC